MTFKTHVENGMPALGMNCTMKKKDLKASSKMKGRKMQW